MGSSPTLSLGTDIPVGILLLATQAVVPAQGGDVGMVWMQVSRWCLLPASVVWCGFIHNEGLIPGITLKAVRTIFYITLPWPPSVVILYPSVPPSHVSSCVSSCVISDWRLDPCFWLHTPLKVMHLKAKICICSSILQKPFTGLDKRKVFCVCLSTQQEGLSLYLPLWRRSMEISSLRFYFDSLGLEKLKRSLLFLLLWMKMKPFELIGF